MQIKFLGTGGGRYVTGLQNRDTGGIIVKTQETQIHIDPGPGALVHSHKKLEKPLETEAVIASHAHPDHSNDIQAIIGMMTQASNKPGVIFGSKSVLKGHKKLEKTVSEYHKNLCSKVKILKEDKTHQFKDIKIKSQSMRHEDPTTQGFTLETQEKTVGFWTDTEYSENLLELYKNCETMVIYCSRPKNSNLRGHTSLSDIPKIDEKIKPDNIIITHFGQKFLNQDLEKQKKWVKNKVHGKITFAEDGMNYPGNRSLKNF